MKAGGDTGSLDARLILTDSSCKERVLVSPQKLLASVNGTKGFHCNICNMHLMYSDYVTIVSPL
jgi:hypothetical protein